MTNETRTTRDRLVETAAMLFRQKGYHGTGLTEILKAAPAPKGSLYHHFPNGKPDLAIAAANWASAGTLAIINDAYRDTKSFEEGTKTFCYKLAKFFDISGQWDGCPVTNVLFDGPDNPQFRDHANCVFDDWIDAIATHAVRLGVAPDTAVNYAESLVISLQGSWIMARARQSSDVIRKIPQRLFAAQSE